MYPRSLSQTVTVATFRRYEDAQRVIDRLAHVRFPVDRVAIVARDLQVVQRVTGGLDARRAALQGALSGALGGTLLVLLLGALDLAGSTSGGLALLALSGLVIGAAIGALVRYAGYEAGGGRHDFSSASSFEAGRFDLVADDSVAEEAARLLHSREPAA